MEKRKDILKALVGQVIAGVSYTGEHAGCIQFTNKKGKVILIVSETYLFDEEGMCFETDNLEG